MNRKLTVNYPARVPGESGMGRPRRMEATMRRFLVALALVCCSALTAQADTILLTPETQTLPVFGTASISGFFLDPLLCPLGCLELLTIGVVTGPDVGNVLSFVVFDVSSLGFADINNGMTGTDTIQASIQILVGGPPLLVTSNTVEVIWTAASVPEPSLPVLLLTGIAAAGLFGWRRRPGSIRPATRLV